jgi:hypothetical protein
MDVEPSEPEPESEPTSGPLPQSDARAHPPARWDFFEVSGATPRRGGGFKNLWLPPPRPSLYYFIFKGAAPVID